MRTKPVHGGFSLVELLAVIAIIGTLVSLLIPAVQSTRESARRSQCASNLRQLGIATHAYESARGHLPPPKLGSQFENRGSTLVVLLPYLEEAAAYRDYNLDEPVGSQNNSKITSQE